MELTNQNIKYHELIDAIEANMIEIGTSDFEVSDFFTNGMYVRTVFIPAGSYITSKIHKIEHPYILSQGNITIFTEDDKEEHLNAPYLGITKPGTRRFAKANTDCIWTTFHVTTKKTVEEVEAEIIEQRINHLLINNKIN